MADTISSISDIHIMGISKFREFIKKGFYDIDEYFHPKTYRIKNFIENQSVSDIREVLYNFTDEFTTGYIHYCLCADGRYLGLNKENDRFYSLVGDKNYVFNTVRKFSDQNKKVEFQIQLGIIDDRFNNNQSMLNYELEEYLIECGEQIKDMCYFNSFRYSRERNRDDVVCKMIFTF